MNKFLGIYELADVARYLHASAPSKPPNYAVIRRWVKNGIPESDTINIPTDNLLLAFEDLVSLRMVTALRIAGFSLQHIRRVHKWLQQNLGYPRPFALKDLWISESEIFVSMDDFLVSISRKGQYAMEFIKDWLYHIRRPFKDEIDITFKRVNGKDIACSWSPYPYILLNPLIQFGAPCIEETRIPTKSIWVMFLGGDKPEVIATDYNIGVIKVQSAIEWEQKIANIAA